MLAFKAARESTVKTTGTHSIAKCVMTGAQSNTTSPQLAMERLQKQGKRYQELDGSGGVSWEEERLIKS